MSAVPGLENVTYFEPRPAPHEVPARFASPFAPVPPHPLARRAALELQRGLRGEGPGAGFAPGVLDAPGGGKMFGVLVVSGAEGRVGYLRGFSGMLDGRWNVEGYVPPLFEPATREAFWPAGEAELRAFELEHAALSREAGPSASDERRASIERQRMERSRQLWRQLSLAYVIPNARGERQPLAALFAPKPPPGGAGDCAAPKLLAHAFQHGLKPLALAEFWWGAPPLNGGREAGEYSPPCQDRCGRILPFMFEGLTVEPAPPGSASAAPTRESRLVFEDAWLLVVDKPAGLPLAPSRHARLRDSVLVRLQRQCPDLAKPGVLHSVDAQDAGLVLLSKDPGTHAALRRQLSRREAELRADALSFIHPQTGQRLAFKKA